MRKYVGQEKVKMTDGQFKSVYGYVRMAHEDGRLWVVLDNGYKTSTHVESVEFVHRNCFSLGIDRYMEGLGSVSTSHD